MAHRGSGARSSPPRRGPHTDHRRSLAMTLHGLGALQVPALLVGRDNLDTAPAWPPEAPAWLPEALGPHRVLYDADPTPDHRRGLAGTLHELGIVEAILHSREEGVARLTEA